MSASLARSGLFNLFGQMIVLAQSVLIMPLVVKTTGAEGYGTYILVLNLINVVFGVSSFGLTFRTIRALPSLTEPAEMVNTYLPQMLLHLGCAALLALGLTLAQPMISAFLLDGRSYQAAIPGLYLLAFVLFAQAGDLFRYGLSLNIYTAITTLAPLVYMAAVLSAWGLGVTLDVDALLALQGAVYLVLATAALGLGLHRGGSPRVAIDLGQAWRDVKLGFPLVLQCVTDSVLAVGDRFVIGLLLGVGAVGAYHPAYMLGSLIMMVPRVAGVILPRLLAQYHDAGQQEATERAIDATTRLFFLLGIPFVVGSAFLARPILALLTSPDIAAQSWMVTPVVAAGVLFYGLMLTLNSLAFARSDTRAMFLANLSAAVFGLGANFVLLSLFAHLLVPALVAVTSYAVAFTFLRWRLAGQVGMGRLWPQGGGKIVLAAAAMALPLAIWQLIADGLPASLGGIGAAIALGVVTYGGALLSFGGLTAAEMKMLRIRSRPATPIQ